MKSLILMSLMTLCLFSAAHADVLTPAKKLKIISVDGKLKPSDLEARIINYCIDQKTKNSCSPWVANPLKINANFEVEIPAVNVPSSAPYNNIDNYSYILFITKKGEKTEVATLNIGRSKALNEFFASSAPLKLKVFQMRDVKLTLDGSDIFERGMTLDNYAIVSVSLAHDIDQVGRLDKYAQVYSSDVVLGRDELSKMNALNVNFYAASFYDSALGYKFVLKFSNSQVRTQTVLKSGNFESFEKIKLIDLKE